eukprot:scaffold234153_cov25-Tisochrysis_lutea.AAC.1
MGARRGQCVVSSGCSGCKARVQSVLLRRWFQGSGLHAMEAALGSRWWVRGDGGFKVPVYAMEVTVGRRHPWPLCCEVGCFLCLSAAALSSLCAYQGCVGWSVCVRGVCGK